MAYAFSSALPVASIQASQSQSRDQLFDLGSNGPIFGSDISWPPDTCTCTDRHTPIIIAQSKISKLGEEIGEEFVHYYFWQVQLSFMPCINWVDFHLLSLGGLDTTTPTVFQSATPIAQKIIAIILRQRYSTCCHFKLWNLSASG